MNAIRKSALLAVMVFTAMSSVVFAQGPIQKRINYAINVSHALRMGDYMLPPGRYVLYQINQSDLNLFALYQDDMTHSPIAMIRTTRVEYHTGQYPGRTKMMLDISETSGEAHPVLQGWNIPGEDGWEIISVVSKDDGVLTRVK
jgi:hypothetical protein